MNPFQKIQEIQKLPKKPQPKIHQKLPKITQKVMHKKQKLLIQEVKNTTYTQTLTPTTQTHTDIKRQIKRLQKLYLNTSLIHLFLSVFIRFLFTDVPLLTFNLPNQSWKIQTEVSVGGKGISSITRGTERVAVAKSGI